MKLSRIHTLFSSAFLLFPVVADALEMPQPKAGLWELRVQNSHDGAPLKVASTSQLCLDAAALESNRKTLEEASKNCSKNEVCMDGSKWIMNSVCKISGTPTAVI